VVITFSNQMDFNSCAYMDGFLKSSHIYDKSLKDGLLLDFWKEATVVVIQKKSMYVFSYLKTKYLSVFYYNTSILSKTTTSIIV